MMTDDTPAPPPARIVFPGDRLAVSGSGIRLGNGVAQVNPESAAASASAGAQAAAASPVSPASPHAPNGSTSSAELLVTKVGVLEQGRGRVGVNSRSKRYIPSVDDLVVGIVVEAHAENYRLDIGSTQPAVLPALAFEGATKRNKPNLAVGALVYARVVVATPHMEAELSCTSPHFKKDWVTGQSLYGELVGGYSFTCSTRLARDLLDEDCYVLSCVGRHIPFELAIGVNGRVWINAANHLHIILITNAILNSEGRSKEYITTMVQKIMQAL